MSSNKPPFFIRTSQLSDEEDLIEISHLTGDMRIDPYLLALRYCLDYLWYDTTNCFVAEDSNSGKVLGYIVGTLDTRQQEQRLSRVMLPQIKAHWRTVKPKSLARWRSYLILRITFRNPYQGLVSEYPAHLHINVHPNSQRGGIGNQLITAYEQNLTKNSIRGYHLCLDGDNQLGIDFYEKQGLTRLKQFPNTGKPFVIFYGRKLGDKIK